MQPKVLSEKERNSPAYRAAKLRPGTEMKYIAYAQHVADGKIRKGSYNVEKNIEYAMKILRLRYGAHNTFHLIAILFRLGKIK